MPLRSITLLTYALPAFALAIVYLPLYSYVTPFYASERGVDVAALGLAWILIRMFDAVTDPVMGWLSDRTPARLGRRRFWLMLSVPVILLGTWQTFVPPESAGLSHAVIWLFVVTLGWTMAQTPYAAWGAELAPDYRGRTRVTAWRESVVLMGTLGATILYFQAGEGGDGLRSLALCVLIWLPLSVLLTAFTVPDTAPVDRVRLNFSVGFQALRENQPFVRLLGAWFVNGLANGVPVTLFLFFSNDRLLASESAFDMGGEAIPAAAAFLLTYFLAAILAMPFWSWLAGRISKHRAWGVAMIWACSIFAFALTLGPGDIVPFLWVSILTGLAFGADLALPPSIQADVVELDTQRTGAARAGLFFAIWQVATKAALALASGLALIVLGLSGFVADGDNTPTALWTLSILYAGVPIAFKLFAVALVWNFPLGRLATQTPARA